MLMASMTMTAFNIGKAQAERDAPSAPFPAHTETGVLNEWRRDEKQVFEFDRRPEGLIAHDWRTNGSRRLIVSVNASESETKSLEKTVSEEGGNVMGAISLGDKIQALTVEVPIDRIFPFSEELRKNRFVQYVEPDSIVNASFVPNDPCWLYQWGPKKIQADWAWNTTVGLSETLVAIIDTGICYTHPDLAANYVASGYDWVNDDPNPMDDNGHGSHCAGIVAAQINNSIGIAGLVDVRIMAEKVLNSAGWGYGSWVVQGIYHAVSVGAKIISLSFGGSSDDPILRSAIQYASSKGVLVVAAAGNTGLDLPHYPAAYEEIIAVSATDANDNLASFSTYGNWIEVSAPGVDIISTVTGDSYAYMTGTSMACPHVTGVAALVWSAFPNYTTSQLRRSLLTTADDLGEPGFDKYFGYGRINARKAVTGLPEHDVSVGLWKHPNRLDPDQNGTFNVTVVNYGTNNETDISVQFLVDSILVDSANIDFLEVDGSSYLSFSWSSAVVGYYNITCYIVPVAAENATDNNKACSMVAVRFPAVLRVPSEYPTVRDAIGSAGENDTILVSEGYYVEGQIDVRKDNLSLVADGTVTLGGNLGGYVLNVRANDVRIEGFDIRGCSTYAFNVAGRGNIITGNTIVGNRHGLHLYNSESCTVSRNLICSDVDGMFAESTRNTVISQNRFVASSFFGGLNLWYSSNNTVTQNTIEGGALAGALVLCGSEGNLLTLNNITGNLIGLVLGGTSGNVLRNNTMSNNDCNFSPWLTTFLEPKWQGATNDVDASNTVNGKPIYYWVNVSDRAVPSDAGFVGLVQCKNITMENLNLRGNYNGIFIINSSNILIRNNSIVHNNANYDIFSGGVFACWYSTNISVISNSIFANDHGAILLGDSNIVYGNDVANNFQYGIKAGGNSIIRHNKISGHQDVGLFLDGSNSTAESNAIMSNLAAGILVYGSNNTITSNTIIANGEPNGNIYVTNREGIMIQFATDCVISSNNVMGCGSYAITTQWSSNNRIFHNNIINNTRTFWNWSPEYSNIWDDGYPSGGNYWTSYNGTDSNDDGIGDTPYNLGPNDTDLYPLMKPFAGNPPPDTYTLTIVGFVDNNTAEGFYDSPMPRPGKYVFAADSTVRIDTLCQYEAYFDHWILDDAWWSSLDYTNVLMEKNQTLTAVFSHLHPLNLSLSPLAATTKPASPVTVKSLESGLLPPRAYIWYVNDTPVLEAASRTWTYTPTKPGNYSLRVNIGYRWALPEYSFNASITVKSPPSVSILPISASIYLGQSIEFTSDISIGSPPYSYRWYVNDSIVPGAGSSNWTFTPALRGTYRIHFDATDNNETTTQSDEALLAIEPRPIASIYPTSSSTYVSKPVTLTLSGAGGHAPSTCQWYVDSSPVPYATSDALNFIPSTPGTHIIYVAVADRQDTVAVSDEATVNAVARLTIDLVPNSTRILAGESVHFVSAASGGYPPFSYQWFLNDSAVSGATSSGWIFTPTSAGGYNVYANITDKYGMTSKSKKASVTAAPQLTISAKPKSGMIFVGWSMTLKLEVSGGYPPYILKWFLDDTFVPNATTSTFLFASNATGTYSISAEVTDSLGNVRRSNTISVQVAFRSVGGESLSIRYESELEHIPPYLILIASFAGLATRRKKNSFEAKNVAVAQHRHIPRTIDGAEGRV